MAIILEERQNKKKPQKVKNILTAIFNTAENYKSGMTIGAKTHLTA